MKTIRKAIRVIGPSIAYIPLTRGEYALVDSDSVAFCETRCWNSAWNRSAKKFYAAATQKRKKIWLHRVLINCPAGMLADHVNGAPLDNRMANLRVATHQQNRFNQIKRPNTLSDLKGVTWHKKCEKWQASIKTSGRTKYLGLFATPEEAHAAYMEAAKALHQEFWRAA